MVEMSIKMTSVVPKRSQPSSYTKDNVSEGKGRFLDAMKGELQNRSEPSVSSEPPAQSGTGGSKQISEKTEQPTIAPGISSSMLAMISQVMGQIPTEDTAVTTESIIAAIPVEGAQVSGDALIQTGQVEAPSVVPQVTSELPPQVTVSQAIPVTSKVATDSKGTEVITQPIADVNAQPLQPQQTVKQPTVQQEVPVTKEAQPQTTQVASGNVKVSAPVAQTAASVVAPKTVAVPETPTKVDTPSSTLKVATAVQKQQGTSDGTKSDTSSDANDTKKEEDIVGKFAPTDKLMSQKENGVSFVKISDEANNLDKTPVEQVVNSVKQNLDNGKKEFVIDLFPTNLGKISVKLISQGGTLLVELAAQNPRTQSMLLANSGEIKELVQATTGTITQVVAPNQNESLQQNYTQQEKEKEGNPQQQQNENAEEQSNTENPVNFMEVLQKLRQSQQIVTSY